MVTISGKVTSFKDFEVFTFTDNISGMTPEEAVSTFSVYYSPVKPIGSLTDQTLVAGSSVNLSTILSSPNADGGSYSWIKVYDSTGENNFVYQGVEIDASSGAWVSANDLSNITKIAYRQNTQQTLMIQT